MSTVFLARAGLRARNGISKTLHFSTSCRTGAGSPKSGHNRYSLSTAPATTAMSPAAYAFGSISPRRALPLHHSCPQVLPPPTDPTSSESFASAEQLETNLQALPALKALRERADANEWYEARSHQPLPEGLRINSFTGGVLRGPGKLALHPLARVKKDESEALIFLHLGRGLCGHDGIIHGGLLATLLDEALARNAFTNFPEKVGVTATLQLFYRAPTRADQFVIIKTQLVEVKGRKATVSGRVEDLKGTHLVEATALFIQPPYAKSLNPTVIRQQIGEAPKEPALVAQGDTLP
ncbi:HotDog domain-containing protein [Mycena rebaudengoi]|nr:HotDog domain-containing protein [Mycena rebaudengoi]